MLLGHGHQRRLLQLFSDNFAGVLDLLIVQDKHNLRTLSLNIKLICTRYVCRTTKRKDNRISTDVTDDANEND